MLIFVIFYLLSSLISVAQFAVQKWTVFSMSIYPPVPVYLAWQRQKPLLSVCPAGLPSQRIVPIKKTPASFRMDNICTPHMDTIGHRILEYFKNTEEMLG